MALAWITNPLTMPSIFYFTYHLGAWVLDTPAPPVAFDMSWEWLTTQLGRVWQPFVLGSLLTAGASAVVGYFGMRALWRWHVVRDWQKRRKKRVVPDVRHKK